MFKTFWISVFCSVAVAAWLQADEPDVVVRLMKDGRPESVLVASGSGRPTSGRLTLRKPVLYLVNPKGPTKVGQVRLADLPVYADRHPAEVARWRAENAILQIAMESGGNWSLGGVRGLKFSGGASMEYGFGARRSIFRSEIIEVNVERFDVPGPLTWDSAHWSLKASSARARLRDRAILAERGPVPAALLKGLDALVLGGPVEIKVTRSNQKIPMILKAPLGAIAQVTDDLVHVKMAGDVVLTQGLMTAKVKNPRGLLGPNGWEWFEGSNPDVLQKAGGLEGEDLKLTGDLLTMNRNEMVVSGAPVRLSSGDWSCETARVKRDLVTGRLRVSSPQIRPRKTKSTDKEPSP